MAIRISVHLVVNIIEFYPLKVFVVFTVGLEQDSLNQRLAVRDGGHSGHINSSEHQLMNTPTPKYIEALI